MERIKEMKKSVIKSNWPIAVFFLAPALLIWIWWTFLPLCKTIQYCLYDFNYALPQNTKCVGFENFVRLFSDKYFIDAIKHR